MGDAKKGLSIPEERFLEERIVRCETLKRAANGRSCLVNPWAELRIPAMEMPELVRQHGMELTLAQHLEEG